MLAFRRKKRDSSRQFSEGIHLVYLDELVANVTVNPFKQRGGEKGTVAVRVMDNAVVEVDDYEQRIYGRYGVSYHKFMLEAGVDLEIMDNNGSYWKVVSGIRATCWDVLKMAYLLAPPWN